MDSLTETLELCRRITTGYRPALRNSPVADCTRRFELLPLRYAAVGGNPAQRARLPKLPGYLNPFQEVGELTHSSYAIRPLREGFLYLLIKRHSAAAYEWHSQYRVAPNGSLLYISADAPWEPAPVQATWTKSCGVLVGPSAFMTWMTSKSCDRYTALPRSHRACSTTIACLRTSTAAACRPSISLASSNLPRRHHSLMC